MRHAEPAGHDQRPLLEADGLRFAVVVSRFNEAITRRLQHGAAAALSEAGASESSVETFEVPGAFELPQAARAAAETGRFDAVVCLGCLIRGATPHFDYIATSVAHGIQEAAGETGVPIAFGVLMTDTWAQAEERVPAGRGNKGFEAAAAAIEMARLFRQLRAAGRR